MLEVAENTIIQLQAQPFQDIVPPAWRNYQEYEQYLDFLGQQFNEHHERDNQILDIYDLLKCPPELLKAVAYNLGMEIPSDEDLETFVRRALQKAITIYRSKGTFDSNNTDVQGIGLWIKALTGYDISITHYPIINPMMFVDWLNYRVALERQLAYTEWTAVHPYEIDPDTGTNRIMYLDELPHYASSPATYMNGVGVNYVHTGLGSVLFDFRTFDGTDINNQVIPDLGLNAGIAFFYDNRAYILFGQNGSGTFMPQYSYYDFNTNVWETETDITLPAGTTNIDIAESNQTKTFRDKFYFIGHRNGDTANNRLFKFDLATRTLTEIMVVKDYACFSNTKCFWVDSGILKGYDFIREETFTLGDLNYSGTIYSATYYNGHILFYADNDIILLYNLYYRTFKTYPANLVTPSIFNAGGNIRYYGNYLLLEKIVTATSKSVLLYFNLANILDSDSGSTINLVGTLYNLSGSGVLNTSFGAYVSAGRITYPSTLIIDIDSSGEFTHNRPLYARKMNIIKTYINRYVQAGVSVIFNDDNPL